MLLPLAFELLQLLLHPLRHLLNIPLLRLRRLTPIMMRRDRQEKDLRNKIVRPLRRLGVEFIRSLLIGVNLRFFLYVDPRMTA